MTNQPVPARGREAETERLLYFRWNFSFSEIRSCLLSFGPREAISKELRRLFVDLQELLSLGSLSPLFRSHGALGKIDARASGKNPDCLGKRHLMHPHEEMVSVSPCAATEAMEELPCCVDVKRWFGISVEGAKSLVAAAHLPQWEVFADDINDIRSAQYIG